MTEQKPQLVSFNQNLPTIETRKSKLVNGQIIEEEYTHVSGKELKEVKKMFDKVRKNE